MSNLLIADTIRGTLRPLRESVERDANTGEKVREWLEVCVAAVPMIGGISASMQRCLLGGIEGSKLVSILQEAKDALEMAAAVFAKVQELAALDQPMSNGTEAGRTAVAQGLQTIRDELAEIDRRLAWLAASRPKMRGFSPATGPYQASEYTKIEDILGSP